jgi:hypothetical protein
VPNNDKGSNSHSLVSGSGETSKLNNYMWSESEGVTNEESIKVVDLISKYMNVLSTP